MNVCALLEPGATGGQKVPDRLDGWMDGGEPPCRY